MSWPAATTLPDVGVTIPQMILISVVLPAPFGPSRAKISPLRISRSTSLRPTRPEGQVLVSWEMEIAGVIARHHSAFTAAAQRGIVRVVKVSVPANRARIEHDG